MLFQIPTRTVVQVRTHAQKFFLKHAPSVFSPLHFELQDIYTVPPRYKEQFRHSYPRKIEETVPHESSETSESTLPSESEISTTPETVTSAASIESATNVATMSHISVNVFPQNNVDFTSMSCSTPMQHNILYIPAAFLAEHDYSAFSTR